MKWYDYVKMYFSWFVKPNYVDLLNIIFDLT